MRVWIYELPEQLPEMPRDAWLGILDRQSVAPVKLAELDDLELHVYMSFDHIYVVPSEHGPQAAAQHIADARDRFERDPLAVTFEDAGFEYADEVYMTFNAAMTTKTDVDPGQGSR